jgi:hypothetical protein
MEPTFGKNGLARLMLALLELKETQAVTNKEARSPEKKLDVTIDADAEQRMAGHDGAGRSWQAATTDLAVE